MPSRGNPRNRNLNELLVSGSSRPLLARELKKSSTWGEDNPAFEPINDKTYPAFMDALIRAARTYGLVTEEIEESEALPPMGAS